MPFEGGEMTISGQMAPGWEAKAGQTARFGLAENGFVTSTVTGPGASGKADPPPRGRKFARWSAARMPDINRPPYGWADPRDPDPSAGCRRACEEAFRLPDVTPEETIQCHLDSRRPPEHSALPDGPVPSSLGTPRRPSTLRPAQGQKRPSTWAARRGAANTILYVGRFQR